MANTATGHPPHWPATLIPDCVAVSPRLRGAR